MDCVAVGWLVWVALLVGGIAGWSVYEVFAGGWRLWAAVWAVGLLFWERTVGWPSAESVVFGWVLGVVGGVGGMFIVGLVSGRLVGGWWRGRWLGEGVG